MRLLPALALFMILFVPAMADQASDDALFDQVRMQLAKDREVGGGKIDVKVTDGNIELSGVVKSEKIKEKAERIVKKVKGTKSVVNRITVGPAEAR